MDNRQMPKIRLKWMRLRIHAQQLERIVDFGFKHPLLADFFDSIKENNCIACLVAEDLEKKGEIVGYVVYQWDDKWIYIFDIAVLPGTGDYEVEKQIINEMVARVRRKRRLGIIVDVRETNSSMLMLLKKCGFKAVKVMRNFYKKNRTGREDSFRMAYNVDCPLKTQQMPIFFSSAR